VARWAQFPRRRIIMGARKSPSNVTSTFFNSRFASERPQIRTWGRQTCFLSRAPPNLVTPLYTPDISQNKRHHVFANLRTANSIRINSSNKVKITRQVELLQQKICIKLKKKSSQCEATQLEHNSNRKTLTILNQVRTFTSGINEQSIAIKRNQRLIVASATKSI